MTYARNDYGGALATGLGQHQLTHDAAILGIEMAHGFIGQQEIERLTERANHGNTLLLPETHARQWSLTLVGYSKRLEP